MMKIKIIQPKYLNFILMMVIMKKNVKDEEERKATIVATKKCFK